MVVVFWGKRVRNVVKECLWEMRDRRGNIIWGRKICRDFWLGIIMGLCSQIHQAAHTITYPTHAEKFPAVYILSPLSDLIFEILVWDKLLSTYKTSSPSTDRSSVFFLIYISDIFSWIFPTIFTPRVFPFHLVFHSPARSLFQDFLQCFKQF